VVDKGDTDRKKDEWGVGGEGEAHIQGPKKRKMGGGD